MSSHFLKDHKEKSGFTYPLPPSFSLPYKAKMNIKPIRHVHIGLFMFTVIIPMLVCPAVGQIQLLLNKLFTYWPLLLIITVQYYGIVILRYIRKQKSILLFVIILWRSMKLFGELKFPIFYGKIGYANKIKNISKCVIIPKLILQRVLSHIKNNNLTCWNN